ncbi:MAG: peptide chain release factor N(5)-glutamine methyltransferase [Nitrospiraceae bacterium]|nr:MAG: peptide chain release factor N(5)-glutamine methyltransferase [Nitrospiraceae bacterium]
MKALEKIREISSILVACGIEAVDKEAEIIVSHVLGLRLSDIFTHNPELTGEQTGVVNDIACRRKKREPLQYITGHCEFMGMKILVGRGVLIPRPETELMVELAIKKVISQKSKIRSTPPTVPPLVRGGEGGVRILDLCTGSGCISLALAKEFPEAHVYGTDISEAALDFAKRNADLNRINNVAFFRGHLLEPLNSLDGPASMFDLIISNPPYIKTGDIKTLQPEIREWEPFGALDGGADGLNFYREIISQAGKFLKTNGILMLELGEGCADDTADMMKEAGYLNIGLHKDYAGIERIIQGRWTS